MSLKNALFFDSRENGEVILTLWKEVNNQFTAIIDEEGLEVGGDLGDLRFFDINLLINAIRNVLTGGRLCEPEHLLAQSSARSKSGGAILRVQLLCYAEEDAFDKSKAGSLIRLTLQKFLGHSAQDDPNYLDESQFPECEKENVQAVVQEGLRTLANRKIKAPIHVEFCGSTIDLEGKFASRANLACFEPKQVSLYGRLLGFDTGRKVLLMQVERKVLEIHYLEDELPLVQVAELAQVGSEVHVCARKTIDHLGREVLCYSCFSEPRAVA